PCPCGSGRKFKHCCLDRTPQPPSTTRAPVAARIAEAEALERAGQTQQAATVFATLLTEASDSVAVLKATALHCYRQGDRGNALVLLRRANALDAADADLANLLGALLIEVREFEEAIVCLYRAIGQNPQLLDARANLGYALFSYGKDAEAEAALRQALAIAPDHAGALLNLATVLRNVGRFDEAMACLRAVLVKDESNLAAWHNLAQTLQDLGRFADSRRCYEEAARLAPGSAIVQCNLGMVLKELGEHEQSLASFERALMLDPALAEAHLRIGMIRKEQGRLEEALACFSRALAVRPDFHAAHSNILFTTAFMDNLPQRRILELHREWATLQTAHVKPPLPHANAREPNKLLRIGYVSPDFRQHACAAFLEPLLRHHDRTQVRVFAYAGVPNPDQKTAELRALVDEWRSTVGVDDDGVNKMIREDGIDVLIDLAGHTANNRLLALAGQPAPVQVTYLGYPATTGLPAMAWRLTDAVTEPPGTGDEFYTERLCRLPHSLWCYQPFTDMGAVSASPAATNGYLTFGSFNSYSKVGPRVIELWARVLVAIP
ncbi:MAG: tetratricopeptide repeat protein, partial [Betaproteobacteria bacterium]|nr:tetratricopeptide repeat protein [Betaproteobacteria bacterium]